MIELKIDFSRYLKTFETSTLTRDVGKVTHVTGFLIQGFVPGACVGSICEIFTLVGKRSFLAEVIGFKDRYVLLMPLGEMQGVGMGSKIVLLRSHASIRVGKELLGRVIDGMGMTLDKGPELDCQDELSIYGHIPGPMTRPPIDEPLALGVRSIDGLCTVGKGQRIGIMAGSGVGKSVLLGMMARSTSADVNVIALIGERGREVREFIEHTLGEEGLKKSVIVCATSDQSPLLRMRGAFVAATIAQYFSAQGKDVLFMMDSVTRFAMAQREIGLNAGEPPASKGYTPSVFSLLPKLLERAGTFDNGGSITGLFTVLVEGDDMDDPIGDAVRSIVDGHIVLDRKLAHRGHFPAIDILQSTSRVMRNVVSQNHIQMANEIRKNISVYREAEDLINIGAYKKGTSENIDQAIRLHPQIESFLRQEVEDASDLDLTYRHMQHLVGGTDGGEH
ncbi:MAG: FliI/YscN family ATPase [Bdellovibrionales bacterium]|nr:FliI/YscN family ATPase [Bdellovibrionales bacterium]